MRASRPARGGILTHARTSRAHQTVPEIGRAYKSLRRDAIKQNAENGASAFSHTKDTRSRMISHFTPTQLVCWGSELVPLFLIAEQRAREDPRHADGFLFVAEEQL